MAGAPDGVPAHCCLCGRNELVASPEDLAGWQRVHVLKLICDRCVKLVQEGPQGGGRTVYARAVIDREQPGSMAELAAAFLKAQSLVKQDDAPGKMEIIIIRED